MQKLRVSEEEKEKHTYIDTKCIREMAEREGGREERDRAREGGVINDSWRDMMKPRD